VIEEDLPAAQRVFEAAPGYFAAIGEPEGALAGCAEKDFRSVPEGFPRERKHYFGVYHKQNGTMIGLADYLDGYPGPGVGFVGLLVFDEQWQRQGLGKEAWRALSGWAAAELGAREFRLGVVETNRPALDFWKSLGFVQCGVKEPAGARARVLVLTAPRPAPAAKAAPAAPAAKSSPAKV